MAKRSKRPPSLAQWIEKNVRLPEGTAAVPGRITLHPYQVGWCDALADPAVERVTIIKSARVGYTTCLTGLIAYHVMEDPASVLCLLPTQADCRDFIVSDIEATFDGSPALAGRLSGPKKGGDRINRNTITHRLFRGGSLKIVAGKAPRNLRRHSARVLLVDEADGIEASAEGDPISLAERRTMSFANRKIICGSTPLDEATSPIARLFSQSDQRIWEVPCPHCRAFAELQWSAIEWPDGRPEQAAWRCPSCHQLVGAEHRARMASAGRWRALRPDVLGHAGFRISALASLLPGAAWGKLAAEYLSAKDDDATLRVFQNTVLGLPWSERADEIEEGDLASRVEGFDLDHIPADVLAVTVGADCADDRVELSFVGHTRDGAALVLSHQTIWGSVTDGDTWAEVDALLRQRWRHPHGGLLRVDAAVIDAGDGDHYDHVMAFCRPRLPRRIMAGKGVSGFARPAIQMTKTRKAGRLFIVAPDVIKTTVFNRLARGRTIRFSHTLEPSYFEQLCGERRIVRMARGKPVIRFERKPGVRKVEALDCMVYALAAKAALALNAAAFDQRADELKSASAPPPQAQQVHYSPWIWGNR
jgi:phage terminase large subunit GpA-like protein